MISKMTRARARSYRYRRVTGHLIWLAAAAVIFGPQPAFAGRLLYVAPTLPLAQRVSNAAQNQGVPQPAADAAGKAADAAQSPADAALMAQQAAMNNGATPQQAATAGTIAGNAKQNSAGGTVGAVVGDLSQFGFGVALGVAFNPKVNVANTTVQNNVLLLTGGSRQDIGFWASIHYFWGFGTPTPANDKNGQSTPGAYPYGWGPFIGVQLGGTNNTVVEALGAGLMIGARISPDSTNSLNIGFGYAARHISVLTNGLSFDQTLPAGVTSATTRDIVVGAPIIVASFAF